MFTYKMIYFKALYCVLCCMDIKTPTTIIIGDCGAVSVRLNQICGMYAYVCHFFIVAEGSAHHRLNLWRWCAVFCAIDNECAVWEPLGNACGIIHESAFIARNPKISVWRLSRFAVSEFVYDFLVAHNCFVLIGLTYIVFKLTMQR